MLFENKEHVFTDGAALANGYNNCSAGWGVFFDDLDVRNCSAMISSGPVSNQVAELTAVSVALEILCSTPTETPTCAAKPVVIVTDSKYVVDCLTKWYKQWEKNNWQTQKGEPVKHRVLIQKCRGLLSDSNRPVTFLHVNSHQRRPKGDKKSISYILWYGNSQADSLASKTVTKNQGVTVTW